MKNRKGVYLRVIGYDDKFHRLQHPAIMMNDFNIDLEADRAKLNNLIYASLDGDSLSSSASCDCGAITGMDNYGIRCKECLSLSYMGKWLDVAATQASPQEQDNGQYRVNVVKHDDDGKVFPFNLERGVPGHSTLIIPDTRLAITA